MQHIDRIWSCTRGTGPLVSLALHDGHQVRPEIVPWLEITPQERLREEDPRTARWTVMAPTRVVALRSRFEVDLNRPEERAIYRTPEESWGLRVWSDGLPESIVEHSLAQRQAFYDAMESLFSELLEQVPIVVLFDLHTYNHRRAGPGQPAADPAGNPQVDVGVFLPHRDEFAPLIDRFEDTLRVFPFPTGPLDVRENVRFPVGPFAEWVHSRFPVGSVRSPWRSRSSSWTSGQARSTRS